MNIFILGQLQIGDSQENDSGKYECVAENSVGSQYSYSAQLYVRSMYIIYFLYEYGDV